MSQILDYVILGLGILLMIAGLVEVFTGKVLGSAKKVQGLPMEKVRKYARIDGITNLVCGAVILVIKALALAGKITGPFATFGILIVLIPAIIGEVLKHKVKEEK